MRKIILVILCLFVSSILLKAEKEHDDSNNPFEELRKQVLSLTPDKLNIDSKTYKKRVYAVIMETGYGDITVSLVSITDGTTSLYFSNGGGIIGAGEYPDVRKTTFNFLKTSEKYLSLTKLTKTFPLPKKGEVKFYFIAKNGVYTYTASENSLGNQKDKLSKLFYAGQHVISEIRKIQEKL